MFTKSCGTRFFAVVASVVFALVAAAAPASAVTLDWECGLPDCTFSCIDTMDVWVTVDAVTDLRGFSLTLEYDAAVMQVVSVEGGDLVSGGCPFVVFWINPNPPFGFIEVDGAGPGCSVDGPGRLVHIRFVGIGHGISPLTCSTSLLRDSLNAPIAHTCNTGSATFYCPPVPTETVTWGRVKARPN